MSYPRFLYYCYLSWVLFKSYLSITLSCVFLFVDRVLSQSHRPILPHIYEHTTQRYLLRYDWRLLRLRTRFLT